MVEGQEVTSGDSIMMVGQGPTREADIYVSRDSRSASSAELWFIAEVRNCLPRLIWELEERYVNTSTAESGHTASLQT